MILNPYAILDAFLTLFRFGLGFLVLLLAFSLWRQSHSLSPEARTHLENRCYLAFSLAGLLLFLNLASWPLLYLLLQSYVPEWPRVMCIYGVTRVGTGSLGPGRFLPALLVTLQVLKPALVFASGAWMTLYLANRHTPHSPLLSRVLVALLAVGLLAVADATTEAAYLILPKKEEFHSAGCCTAVFDDNRNVPAAILPNDRPLVWTAYYLFNAVLIVNLYLNVRQGIACLGLLLCGAILTTVASAVFLLDVAAPTLLRLPHHHCPYDLITRAPEAVVAIVSFLAATLAVGWAWIAGRFADCAPHVDLIHKLQVLALFGYLGSITMITIGLALT